VEDRRRAARTPTQIPARLLLDGGRHADVVISNVGELGVLLTLSDLEVQLREGERAVLEHPVIVDGKAVAGRGATVRSSASVVRVDLDLDSGSVVRHVALYFDGGPAPKPGPKK
jgi:hypothetical protein